MSNKTLVIVGIVAVVAIAAVAIGFGFKGDNNQDEVTDGVNYYGNGGLDADGKAVFGLTSHTVSVNLFSKGDAIFDSWNTKSDGTGTTYYPGNPIDYKDGTSVRLYAIWYDGAYMNYAALGGTGAFTVSYDGKVLSTMDHARFPPSGKITLTITPNVSEGKLVMKDDETIEQRIINGNNVSRTYISFSLDGDADYELTTDGTTGSYTITCNSLSCITINANADDSTTLTKGVYYLSNGAASGYKCIDSNTVANNMFTVEGKTFVSWNTARDGSGTAYKPGDTIEYYGYTTLYAQWA